MCPYGFDLLGPSHGETAVVVEVPHAGLMLDPVSMAMSTVAVRALALDADLYMDEVTQHATEQGASVLIARMSRYFVDLNRDADDYESAAVQGGCRQDRPHGLIWSKTSDGQPVLLAPLDRAELDRRLAAAYWPYHAALNAQVSKKLERYGVAIVISAHSMPSAAILSHSARGTECPDVVLGTMGHRTAAPGLTHIVQRQAHAFGWTVAHDDPYPGGATTVRLGNPALGVHCIQIELARRLYMDEQTLVPNDTDLQVVRTFFCGLVAKLGVAALG